MNKLKKLITYFFGKEKTTTFQDIYLCAAAALTASFLFYEGWSSNITKLIFSDAIITALVFIVWAYCGFISGRRRSIGFPVFVCLYWCVPYVFILYYASRDNVHNYVKLLSYANRISRFIFERPFAQISEKINIAPVMTVFILIIVTGCAYFIGFITVMNKKLEAEPEMSLPEDDVDDNMPYLIIDDNEIDEEETQTDNNLSKGSLL